MFFQKTQNILFLDVEESSMIDVPLMNALLKAVPKISSSFFIEDVNQLPSVGPGKVLYCIPSNLEK